MYKIKLINILLWSIMFFLFSIVARSQQVDRTRSISISDNKTSSIVFSASIVSVDRGSPDVLAQKAKGVDNVLQLKAAVKGFKHTNLTIITADKKLYHFLLSYSENPASLVIETSDLARSGLQSGTTMVLDQAIISEETRALAASVLNTIPAQLHNARRHGIGLSLQGLFVHDHEMFFRLRLENKTNVPFDIEAIRFMVADRAKIARTASQQLMLNPKLHVGDVDVIMPRTAHDVVFVFPSFSIAHGKRCFIELLDRDGGQLIQMALPNRRVAQAKSLEQINLNVTR